MLKLSVNALVAGLLLIGLLPSGSLRADSYMHNPRGSAWSAVTARAVKLTLGPKGRNVAVDRNSFVTGSLTPQTRDACYDYSFVSRREGNIDNIFFANTCSPEMHQATSNTENYIRYTSLAGGPVSTDVAAILIDAFDGMHPTSSLITVGRGGITGWPYRGFHDFLVVYPALGPSAQFAAVTSDTSANNAAIRLSPSTTSAEAPSIVVPADPAGTRTFSRLSWSGTQDPSVPSFGKLVVSLRRGRIANVWTGERMAEIRDDVDRLYIADATTGELAPLKDPADASNQDNALEGREPSFSPDGRKIVFIRNLDNRARLWTCNATLTPAAGEGGGYDCEGVATVPSAFLEPENTAGNDAWPCWSYDSRKIFFSFDGQWDTDDSNRRYTKLYMVNSDGTGLQKLDKSDDMHDDTYPACLPVYLEAINTIKASLAPAPQQNQYQAAPVQARPATLAVTCASNRDCPSGQLCLSDHLCHNP